MSYIIFTDGSSRGNPGAGGWAAILVERDMVKELAGRVDRATNNQMEIEASIEALSQIKIPSTVTIYTDSSYLINGITKWVRGWKNNNWQTQTRQPVLNQDKWEKLDTLNHFHKVEWKYIGGHVGVKGNERCDILATSMADGKKVNLYSGPLLSYSIPNILDISFDSAAALNKSSKSSRSKLKAFSYVSKVDGKIETHATWPECEARVKGKAGARYKKALNKEEEGEIVREFGR